MVGLSVCVSASLSVGHVLTKMVEPIEMPFRGLNRVGVQIPDRHGKGIFWGLYGPMNSLGITTSAFHAARKINNNDIRTAAAGDKALAWPVSQNIFPCREQNPHFAMRPVVKILSLLVFNLTRTWAVAYPRIILHAICVDLHLVG